jgi:hypothetical protein
MRLVHPGIEQSPRKICRLVLRSGYPYAPWPYAAGPLYTALSSFRQLQRHSTPRRRQSPVLGREEIGREMAD